MTTTDDARRQHRIEMIEAEINVLRSIYQSTSIREGQRSLMIKYVADLCAEQRELRNAR